MHLPEIDRYGHLDSPLHRWDARLRMPALLVLLATVVFAPGWAPALLGLAASMALVQLTRIPWGFVLVHVRWVLFFCAFLLVVMALTGAARRWCTRGP